MFNRYLAFILIMSAVITFGACYYPPNTVRVVRYTDNVYHSHIQTYLSRGRTAYLSGNYDMAIYWYWKVLEADRTNETAISMLVSLLEKRLESQSAGRTVNTGRNTEKLSTNEGFKQSTPSRVHTQRSRATTEQRSAISEPAGEPIGIHEEAYIKAEPKHGVTTSTFSEATASSEISRGFTVSPPIEGRLQITSTYGARRPAGRTHRGVDFRANRGTPVYASIGGRVVFAGWSSGYGYNVRIENTTGRTKIQTRYAHLSSISTRRGAYIKQGDVIGRVGSTGNSTGPHLHYEIMLNGSHVDPLSILQ